MGASAEQVLEFCVVHNTFRELRSLILCEGKYGGSIRFIRVWWLARKYLKHGHTEGKNINLFWLKIRVGRKGNNFGCGPANGSCRLGGGEVRVVEIVGDRIVCNHSAVIIIEKDVCATQVAMVNRKRVQVSEPVGDF